MIAATSHLTRLALTSLAVLCLGATVMAGPSPMYMMINGQMMEVRPLPKDVKLKNGCTVCTNGAVITPKGNKTMIKNGDLVTSEGVIEPLAKHLHGG